MILDQAQDWLDDHYRAGAKKLGVSCNPHTRRLYLMADGETLVLNCRTGKHTRIIKEILHDYIAGFPVRASK